eukprot:2226508-Amphidinium_carterae.1
MAAAIQIGRSTASKMQRATKSKAVDKKALRQAAKFVNSPCCAQHPLQLKIREVCRMRALPAFN